MKIYLENVFILIVSENIFGKCFDKIIGTLLIENNPATTYIVSSLFSTSRLFSAAVTNTFSDGGSGLATPGT